MPQKKFTGNGRRNGYPRNGAVNGEGAETGDTRMFGRNGRRMRAELPNESRNFFGRRLHGMICRYCLEANTPQAAGQELEKIAEFLEVQLHKHPEILFQVSENGYSPLADAMNLPFAPDKRCPLPLREEKAEKLTTLLMDTYDRAANGTRATYHNVADILTRPARDGLTPINIALSNNQPKLYRMISEKLMRLNLHGVISRQELQQQFTHPMHGQVTPLEQALRSGNTELADMVLTDMQAVLPKPLMQQQLMHRNDSRWNMLHVATQPNDKKGTPNPFVVDRLQGAFYEAFGPERAKEALAELSRQINNQGFPAYHENQPAWLRRLLATTEQDPIRPSPTRGGGRR